MLHIGLDQRIAELIVSGIDAAFPARLDLLLAIEPLAEEREILIDEGFGRRQE